MKLIRPFLSQGYHLFADNFYPSVKLVKDLFDQAPSWKPGQTFQLHSKTARNGLKREKRVACIGTSVRGQQSSFSFNIYR